MPGRGDARFERTKQRVDHWRFSAEPGPETDVDISRCARTAPAEGRQSTDEAIAPAVVCAERLQFRGRRQQPLFRRSFANHFCCSTSPLVVGASASEGMTANTSLTVGPQS